MWITALKAVNLLLTPVLCFLFLPLVSSSLHLVLLARQCGRGDLTSCKMRYPLCHLVNYWGRALLLTLPMNRSPAPSWLSALYFTTTWICKGQMTLANDVREQKDLLTCRNTVLNVPPGTRLPTRGNLSLNHRTNQMTFLKQLSVIGLWWLHLEITVVKGGGIERGWNRAETQLQRWFLRERLFNNKAKLLHPDTQTLTLSFLLHKSLSNPL